jgi:hypothetical protein
MLVRTTESTFLKKPIPEAAVSIFCLNDNGEQDCRNVNYKNMNTKNIFLNF